MMLLLFRLGPGLLNIALIFGQIFVFSGSLHLLSGTNYFDLVSINYNRFKAFVVVDVVNVVCVYVVIAVFRNLGSAGAHFVIIFSRFSI